MALTFLPRYQLHQTPLRADTLQLHFLLYNLQLQIFHSLPPKIEHMSIHLTMALENGSEHSTGFLNCIFRIEMSEIVNYKPAFTESKMTYQQTLPYSHKSNSLETVQKNH